MRNKKLIKKTKSIYRYGFAKQYSENSRTYGTDTTTLITVTIITTSSV